MKDTNQLPICKRAIGLDVSKDHIEAKAATKTCHDERSYSHAQTFCNQQEGFRELLAWAEEHLQEPGQAWFIMEPTGVYHEELAYFLDAHDRKVCVLVATRASAYADSLPVKSKTDAIDAEILARYGLERQPRCWQPPTGKLPAIKRLLRERVTLQEQHNQLANRLHATQTAWGSPQSTIDRLTDHMRYIEEALADIEAELDQLWTTEPPLAEAIHRIEAVQGLRPLTILTVLAETNGFATQPNRNQLSSYSGLDVVLDESGKHVGATKISKHGTAHIRRALYMPAVSASQHNPALSTFYQRLMEGYGEDQKQKAIVAVMRKLLLLIHSLWKSGQDYDPQFHYRQITKDT